MGGYTFSASPWEKKTSEAKGWGYCGISVCIGRQVMVRGVAIDIKPLSSSRSTSSYITLYLYWWQI